MGDFPRLISTSHSLLAIQLSPPGSQASQRDANPDSESCRVLTAGTRAVKGLLPKPGIRHTPQGLGFSGSAEGAVDNSLGWSEAEPQELSTQTSPNPAGVVRVFDSLHRPFRALFLGCG